MNKLHYYVQGFVFRPLNGRKTEKARKQTPPNSILPGVYWCIHVVSLYNAENMFRKCLSPCSYVTF